MSPEERASLIKMFESVSQEIGKEEAPASCTPIAGPTDGVPDGITERLSKLKAQYMTHKPAITTFRAKAITKITKENPGMPKIVLRAKCFKYCCETAPLVNQDQELIVGAPNGAPRAGAFSPDIAWRWMQDELDTIGTRPQDPGTALPEFPGVAGWGRDAGRAGPREDRAGGGALLTEGC